MMPHTKKDLDLVSDTNKPSLRNNATAITQLPKQVLLTGSKSAEPNMTVEEKQSTEQPNSTTILQKLVETQSESAPRNALVLDDTNKSSGGSKSAEPNTPLHNATATIQQNKGRDKMTVEEKQSTEQPNSTTILGRDAVRTSSPQRLGKRKKLLLGPSRGATGEKKTASTEPKQPLLVKKNITKKAK
jgi:hypothetical protein